MPLTGTGRGSGSRLSRQLLVAIVGLLLPGLLAIPLAWPHVAQAATPEPTDTRELAATPEPTDAPTATPGPRIVWQRSVDTGGDEMFAEQTVRPISMAVGAGGIVLLAEDGWSAAQAWHSSDGAAWERLPDLPGPDLGTRLGGVVAYARGWVAHGTGADGGFATWTSLDGIEWKRTAESKLRPMKGATVAEVVAGGEGLVAIGRAADGTDNDRIWTSPNGRRWRERGEFAKAHPGASLGTMGTMGYRFVTFGRTASGRATAWVAPDDRLTYITRQYRGSAPASSALPAALYVGRDAGLAVVPADEPGDPPQLWRSLNAWDWEPLSATSQPPPQTAFASDGELIVSDRVTSAGAHAIWVGTDGEAWTSVPSDGDVPRTAAPTILAARPDGIVLATADGIWQGAWVERASAVPRRPAYVQPVVEALGADPPLRQPVLRPKGPRRPLDTSVDPSARAERRGVRLEMWLPEGRVRTRDWLPVHVRITNTGVRDITFACGGGYTRAETAALFPRGKRWTGNAAAFKRRVLQREWPGNLGFGWRRGDGDDCPGSVGLDITLAPGGVYQYDGWTIPRYPIRDQPLPPGRLPVVTTLGYRSGDDVRRTIGVRAGVRLVGPRWQWATPQELIDAMLEDPRFSGWLERRDRPIWWDNASFHVVNRHSFYWTQLGFKGPAPDGTVHIGQFAYSWGDFGGGYGRMLLDPWTGQVLGFSSS